MSTNTPLLDLIKAEVTKQFNEKAALQLSDKLQEGGFDDDSVWDDVNDEQESTLKDEIPSAQFAHIVRVCTEYHASKSPNCKQPQSETPKHNAQWEDITNLARNYKNWNKKTAKSRNVFLSQCPGLLNNVREKSFIDALTLGHDNKLPLIMYIADTFSRYRINTFCSSQHKKDISTHDFRKRLPFYKAMESSNTPGTAIHAILSSYHTRFVPKLQFDPKRKIHDNLEDIVTYIGAASQVIDSVLLQRREQNKLSVHPDEDVIPFQLDLVIIPKYDHSSTNINDEYEAVVDIDTDGSDVEESDEDEEEDSYEMNTAQQKKDEIGFIEPRLRKYNIKSVAFDIEKDLLKWNASAHLKRRLNEQFKMIRKGRNGRYVMVVDRRDKEDIVDVIQRDNMNADEDIQLQIKKTDGKTSNNDKVYIYSPKCKDLKDGYDAKEEEKDSGNGFGTIHSNYIDESLLFKTKKCLIPGVDDGTIDTHLGADCTDVITLSFHVLSVDVIRCYLYINGWGARFQPMDLIQLLPIYFEKKPAADSRVLREERLNELFPLKLKDEKFEAWYKETTSKNKKLIQ